MATEVLELQIRVTGAAAGTSQFKSLAAQAQATNRSIVDMSNSLRFMRNVLVGLSFARVFSGLEAGVTAATSISNLFRTVTKNSEDAGAAFNHFFALAQETRTPFEDIAKLAVNISRTIADSPDKLSKVDNIVRNIAESFSLAGANGQTVRNVGRDLVEIFNAGTVQMRLFRAVLQQDRPLLDAISEKVVATGANAAKFNAILDKARQNKTLSGGTVIEALQEVKGALQGSDVAAALSGATKIQSQFALTTETLGQSLSKLNNSWIAFLQHVNDATNSLNFLAKAVDFVADHIPLFVLFVGAIAGLLIIDVVFKAFANFGNLLGLIFNTLYAPIKLIGQAIVGLIGPLFTVAGILLDTLIGLPGFFVKAAETALTFSQYILGAVAAVVEFTVAGVALISGFFINFIVSAAAAAGVAGEFFTTFLLEGVTTVTGAFGALITATGSAGAAFAALASSAAASLGSVLLAAVSSVLETVLLLGPALIAMTVAGVGVAAVGYAIYGLLQPLGQVGEAVGGLGTTWGLLPATVLSTIEVIVAHWRELVNILSALWDDMINGLENKLSGFGNNLANFTERAALFSSGDIGDAITGNLPLNPNAFDTGRKTNSASPLLDGFVARIKAGIPAAQAQINKIVGPFMKSFFDLINGTGPGAAPAPKTKNTQGAFDSAKQGLDSLIAKLEPAAAATARLAEVQKVFDKAGRAGIDVDAELAKFSLTRSEVMRREARDAVGAGNADTDFAGKARLLTQTLKAGSITLEEHDRLLRQAQETQLKTKFDVGSGVQLGFLEEQDRELNRNAVAAAAVNEAFSKLDAARDYDTTVTALNAALAKNKNLQEGVTAALQDAHIKFLQTKTDIGSGEELGFLQHQKTLLDQNAIAADALHTAFAREEAVNKFLIGLQAINDALLKQKISATDAALAIRDLQIEILNTQTDALSGFQRGLLDAQKSMNDFATTAANTVTTAFNDMTDALTKFFDTGQLDFSTLLTDIQTNLTKLAVQQTITGPLSNILGFNQQGGGGIFGTGGPLASLFGGSGLGGITGQLGSSTSNPVYVKSVDAIPGLGGLGGNTGTGSLFGGSSGGIFGDGGFFQNLFNGGGGLGSSSNWLLNLFGGGATSGSGIGELASAADPIAGAAGAAGGSGIFSWLSALFGFATGGGFEVGGDSGATDSQIVAFRATRGEHVTVQTPTQRRNASSNMNAQPAAPELHLHLHGVTDFDSFKKSKSQISTGFAGMANRHQRRNGG